MILYFVQLEHCHLLRTDCLIFTQKFDHIIANYRTCITADNNLDNQCVAERKKEKKKKKYINKIMLLPCFFSAMRFKKVHTDKLINFMKK